MRDKLIHAYFGINRAIIWRTLRDDIPPLRSAVQRLLDDPAVEEETDLRDPGQGGDAWNRSRGPQMRRIPGPPQYGPGTDLIGHAHPTGEIYINKPAREVGVSPGSVKSYADAFGRDGLLTVTRPGTARLLSLENDSFAARELKRACMPLLLVRAGTGEIAPESISVTVYGSTAAGTFDEQSDTDILVTGDENQVDHDRVPAPEIGRPLLPVGADER